MIPSILLAVGLGASPPLASLHHLDGLRHELKAADGRTLAYWARAAAPGTPSGPAGPYRELPQPGAPLGMAVAARAAVVYAQAGDAAHAREALAGVFALARPNGSFAAELDPQGRPGAGTATAEAIWAIGLAQHALAPKDRAYAAELRRRVAGPVERLLFATVPSYRRYHKLPGGQAPAWFLEGSPAATALAEVGLAAMHEDGPNPALRLLMRRYGEALLEHRRGGPARFPFGAPMPDANAAAWRADQAFGIEALVRAGKALHEARWLAAARQVADDLAVHQLLEGAPPSGPADVWPLVRGLAAVCGVTGEARYGRLAGLLASDLAGRYDPAAGRFDDRPGDPELQAGAPATLAGLLALQAVAAQPRSWEYLGARAVGQADALALQPPLVARTYALGDRRVWVVRNYGSLPRAWRQGKDAFGLRGYQAVVLERAAGM